MATTLTPVSLTSQYRRAQRSLMQSVGRDVDRLWRLFNVQNVDSSWSQLRQFLKLLVTQRRQVAAGLGSSYYRQLRNIHGFPDKFDTPAIDRLANVQLNVSLDVSGPVEFKKQVSEGTRFRDASDKARTKVQGSSVRHVLNGGREQVVSDSKADKRALGWIRVTDGNPCGFCAMLASRGAVYKSESNALDPRGAADRYHDHCGCVAVPVFSRDDPVLQESERFSRLWNEVSAGLPPKEGIKEFRRAYGDVSNG